MTVAGFDVSDGRMVDELLQLENLYPLLGAARNVTIAPLSCHALAGEIVPVVVSASIVK